MTLSFSTTLSTNPIIDASQWISRKNSISTAHFPSRHPAAGKSFLSVTPNTEPEPKNPAKRLTTLSCFVASLVAHLQPIKITNDSKPPGS